MRRKSWYNASAAGTVHVVAQPASLGPSRRLHKRVAPGLLECLAYPLIDGPGVAILIFLPPVLLFQSLPTFDVISIIDPFNRGNWALGLLVLPIFLPMMFSFAMVLGYALLFFGQMFVASALGEPDHPRWPEWDPHEITEGIGRWIWAGIFGGALAGFPVLAYWVYCGDVDWFDRVVIFDLVVLATGYALMSLAASLLHDSLAAANPYTVVRAIGRVGWDYVMPCLTGAVFLLVSAGSLWGVVRLIGSFKLAILALYGFWVFSLYAAMVILRMLGLTYHAHSVGLLWFQGRPKWGKPARFGRIYSNS
jgi:hypothetical protein